MPQRKLPALGAAPSLQALTASTTEPGERLAGARRLPLDRIDLNPRQVRQIFSTEALDGLRQSITELGVLQPIVVRQLGERYQIVAGERRYRAAQAAGAAEIPAIIVDLDDLQAARVTITENVQREALDLEDEARWLEYLQTLTGLSGRELARQLGLTANYVSRRLRLLRHPQLLAAIRDGRLTQREALDRLAGGEEEDALEEVERAELDDALAAAYEADTVDSSATADAGTPAAVATEAKTPEVYHGGTRAAGLVAPGPAPFRYRPFQRFAREVERLGKALDQTTITTMPPDEQTALAEMVDELQQKLDAVKAVLQTRETEERAANR